jgi:hypothetical protein
LGQLNNVFNSSDFLTDETNLTIGEGDTRYLKSSGGTATGLVNFNNGLSSSATVTVPSITLNQSLGISQTNNMIGFLKTFSSAITGGSINNGTVSSPAFNTVLLGPGVWMVSYYHNITCSASVTFTQIVHGITTSSTGGYSQVTSQSSYVSETLASGSKYLSGTYIYRNAFSANVYAPILITYTTAGTVTINLGMNAIRIA